MYWLICPFMVGGQYNAPGIDQQQFVMLFQTGWFIESIMTQTLVIHMLRSPKFPFIGTRASWAVTVATTTGIAVGTALPFIPWINEHLTMAPLHVFYFLALFVTILAYLLFVTLMKWIFVKRYKELL